ncbi:MAG: hypothetical protein SH818_11020 [Saprospiraceae bacterium]|nr:hypothetical protein [Saprospiraceae bacterium]
MNSFFKLNPKFGNTLLFCWLINLYLPAQMNNNLAVQTRISNGLN